VKILVLHQFYLAPGDPGGSRFNELAKLWAHAGHDVTVIAGNLNYATGLRTEGTRGRWLTRQADGAVAVVRCHVPASYNSGLIGRLWAFLGFTLSSSTAVLRERRPDIVIATSPPLNIAVPGVLAARARFRGARWVFEVRDLWPESAVTTGVMRREALLTRFLYRLERWACANADRINVLTPAFKDDLISRGLTTAGKVFFVPNGVDVDAFTPGSRDNEVRRALGWGDDFVALYAGAHGRANALHQLIDAAAALKDQAGVRIVSVGDGPERIGLAQAVKARGLTNIQFIGSQPKSRMPWLVNAADAGLAVLQANPTFKTVYPNKVFDYMACARPTVLAIDGVARTLVCHEADAGLFAEPENGAQIAARIREFVNDPPLAGRLGSNGRAWVVNHASRDVLAKRYLQELQACISSTS
jgi:glycosyltransferase involved in cell wall biosynthesis